MKIKKIVSRAILGLCCVTGVSVTAVTLASCDNTETQQAEWTVTFNSNGGSAVESVKVKDGETVTKPTDPTYDGYKFLYWTADGKTEYDFTKPVNANTTLVAVWQVESSAKSFTVTFHPTGGTVSTPTVKVDKNKAVDEPTDPEREGYIFVHWAKEQDSNEAYDFSTPVTTNLVLYAVWDTTITFVTGEGGSEVKSVVVREGTHLEASELTTPNNSNGYLFKHWSTADRGPAYAFHDPNLEEGAEDKCTPVTGPITLYAVWDTFLVTYADGVKNPTAFVKNGDKAVKPADPVMEDAKFVHWSTTQYGEEAYAFDEVLEADLVLYAVYDYTVTFDSGENGTAVSPVTVRGGKTFAKPEVTMVDTATGKFLYWGVADKDGVVTEYDFESPVTAPLTLVAVYGHDVVFDANGGTFDEEGTTSVTVGVPHDGLASAVAAPVRDGYKFVGWSATADDKLYDFETSKVTANVNLHAVWKYNAEVFAGDLTETDFSAGDQLYDDANVTISNATDSAGKIEVVSEYTHKTDATLNQPVKATANDESGYEFTSVLRPTGSKRAYTVTAKENNITVKVYYTVTNSSIADKKGEVTVDGVAITEVGKELSPQTAYVAEFTVEAGQSVRLTIDNESNQFCVFGFVVSVAEATPAE